MRESSRIVADPLGGSYFVEELTDEMERQAEELFAERPESALNYLDKAIRLAPDFAAAWAGVSDALVIGALYGGGDPADAIAQARANCSHALALDPENDGSRQKLAKIQE